MRTRRRLMPRKPQADADARGCRALVPLSKERSDCERRGSREGRAIASGGTRGGAEPFSRSDTDTRRCASSAIVGDATLPVLAIAMAMVDRDARRALRPGTMTPMGGTCNWRRIQEAFGSGVPCARGASLVVIPSCKLGESPPSGWRGSVDVRAGVKCCDARPSPPWRAR